MDHQGFTVPKWEVFAKVSNKQTNKPSLQLAVMTMWVNCQGRLLIMVVVLIR